MTLRVAQHPWKQFLHSIEAEQFNLLHNPVESLPGFEVRSKVVLILVSAPVQ
jgi:hypothetical protein